MSAIWQQIESGKVPAFWDDGNAVHACEGAEVHDGVFLMWTKCHRDVPAGAAYVLKQDQWTYGGDVVTCQKCGGRS